MIKSLRGMNDILSEDYKRFTYFINTATKIAQNYGFHFIQYFEHLQIKAATKMAVKSDSK